MLKGLSSNPIPTKIKTNKPNLPSPPREGKWKRTIAEINQ
jgi:hypothetical protein